MERHDRGSKRLLAGAVKRPITPTIQGRRVFIAGDPRMRQATDIHDELWARAVAVRCGENTLVLLALDLLGLSPEHISYIREHTQEILPSKNLIVTCTRTHAGPDVTGQWSKGWLGSGLNLRYIRFLLNELVEVIHLAIQAMQPVDAYLARQEVPDPCDDTASKELAVLQFRGPENRTIATIVNFPLVPQVIDEHNTLISADLAHWLCAGLEGRDDRGQVALYICAEASEHPAPPFRDRSWAEAERIGCELSRAVRSSLAGIPPTTIERLQVWRKSVHLPPGSATAKGRRQTKVSGNGSGKGAASEIGLIEFGPARMAVVPGLLAPQVGQQVRKMLDAPYRFILGVSNDDLGFIPHQEAPNTPTRATALVGTLVLDELDRLLLLTRGTAGG
jgi:hypothetical protein